MSITSAVFPKTDWQRAEPGEVGIDAAALERAIGTIDAISLTQGVDQTLVIRDGRMVWAGDDIDNLHVVWSCCKSFASLCLGLLCDDGKCALDDPACRHVPELAVQYPEVTLRHFANMTSGYRGQTEGDALAYFRPAEPLHAPGAYYHYSQASDMLAFILTRIAGEPLRDLFRRRIAEPIGLDPAGWRWDDWGAVDGVDVCGGSGMYDHGVSITARQIARVAWLLANQGAWDGRQILSETYVAEMTRPQVANRVPSWDLAGWYRKLPGSYGLHHWVNGVTPEGKRMWPLAPADTSVLQGNNNNFAFAIPSWRAVVVRLGTDGRINFARYDEVFYHLRQALGDGTV